MQAVLIGDVVGSRRVADRAGLQARLLEALRAVATEMETSLAVTLGDEFQGTFPSVQRAVAASWKLHLATLGFARLRIGIGWGEISVRGEPDSPFGQDGPAWWRARDSVEFLAADASPARTRVIAGSGIDDLINAFLVLRDANLDGMDEVDATIVSYLGAGERQRAIAGRVGLHESSVSRRIKRRHLASLVMAATPIFDLGEAT